MGKYLKNFENHTQYESYINGSGAILPNVSLCVNENEVHYNPYDPYAGHDYVEIGGLKWATMNIGANSITGTGLYFQWGDTQGYTADQVGSGAGKKYFDLYNYKYGNGPYATSLTKYNDTDGKIVLDIEDDAARAAWGGSWRTPTKDDFATLSSSTTSAYTTNYDGSNVPGIVFTSKSDSTKELFLPFAGFAFEGSAYGNEYGRYWSSSLNGNSKLQSYGLNLWESSYKLTGYNRAMGLPIRAVVGQ